MKLSISNFKRYSPTNKTNVLTFIALPKLQERRRVYFVGSHLFLLHCSTHYSTLCLYVPTCSPKVLEWFYLFILDPLCFQISPAKLAINSSLGSSCAYVVVCGSSLLIYFKDGAQNSCKENINLILKRQSEIASIFLSHLTTQEV